MAVPTVNDDYNIQEAWDEVCRSFAKTTNLDLTAPAASKYTIDEVLQQIRIRQDEDEQRNAKYKLAKDAISKTLTCIEVLGGIAAQGASMVFGPSALCFNAVSYLIQAGAQFKRIFTGIADLFKRISDVLERCKIYLRMPPDAVDISLRRIINEEMLCFVDICALSTKVLKGNKALITLKIIAFNSDEGVSAQLARLAQLVERESQMRATLGFESQKSSEKAIVETREGTKTVTASVDKLLEYRQQDEKNSVAKKQLQEIDANLDNPSNNLTAMQGKYRDLTERKVEGSGKWILSDPVYTRWASKNAESPLGVLCLSGGEGYGKSYLFATIIRDLQERLSQAADDLIHSSSAFYFFEQGTATRGGAQYADSDSPLLVKALKTVAYQLATHDPVYRKSLVSSTKTLEGNQIPHLWDALFAKSYKTDSTFYILLDGADRISWENLKHLLDVLADLQKTSNTWDQFRLRILFSARDETVRRIKKKLDEGTSIIDVAANNSGDVEAFIKSRLSSMEIFSSDTSQVKALESEILDRLLKTAQGDFVNIDLLLNEIGGKRRPGEIRDVLSRSGEKRSDTIARKVQRLNETLSENSISDLNELLVWVIHARCPLELGELEAVLYVKNGEPSLRSLADEINDKYSALFRIEGEANSKAKTIPTTATVSIVSESIKEYFSGKSASEEATSYDEIPSNGDVTESEVQIVRHFLNMVCEPKLFKKFDFDSFFERKLTKKTARLGFDNDTAHLRILLGCLKAITMEQTDLSSGLVDYATFYFYDHLDLIDLSLIQPRSKAIVGTQLVQTFTDEKTFTPWWTSNRLWMRDKWLYDDKRVDTVLKWLQDSAVTKKISEKDQEWIKSLSSKSKPDTDLLEHVARFIARKWLQDSYWDSQETFYWVNAYENKIANRKDPNVKRETDDPNPKGLTAARVHEIAEFSRPFLGLETLGYEETRNVARTLRNFGKLDDAVEAFKLAMSLEEDNWFAKWGLAQTYGEQKKYALAIQTIEEVKVSIEGGQAKAYEPRSHLNHVNRMLAGWYREIGNVDQAWEIYESILRDNPDDYETTYSMIVLLHGKGSYTMLFEFLEGLKKSVDETTGLDRCTQIFHEYYWKDEYHDTIAAAVRGTTGMMTLKESYLTAIDAAEKKVQRAKDQLDRYGETYAKSIMALLMHYYAKFFHKRHTSPEEKEVALDMWVRIIQLDASDNWQLLRAKSFATECLSSVYLQEALRAGQGTTLAAKFIDNLEHISSMRTDESEEDRTTKEYPLQLLARYHALSGETGKAKNALRAFVKSNIDLLSDDDPANDWQGYIGLAMHFMFAGQDDNSLAAWSLIVPNPEEQGNGDKDITVARETESAPQPETSESLEGPLDFYCDGKCGVTWTYANDVYVCRECADVQFDEACLKRLKEGSLNMEVCDESHEMLHVPKYDAEKLRRIGKGNVMVGQEIMTVQGWIQKIKQDWGLFVEDVK